MESIRDQVLKQIANVCSGHVAMFEPFAEWNKNPMRRGRISSRGYFAAGFADLRRYGFEPVFTSGDMPTKLAMEWGLSSRAGCRENNPGASKKAPTSFLRWRSEISILAHARLIQRKIFCQP
jgi:hypothetical protein